MLLEIFDSYRQSINIGPYKQWRRKYVWLNLAHVCRRWRAVMFASSNRLDLSVIVGPQNPSHIKTILSSPLPISIEYRCLYSNITGSALWRMLAALRHRDRVREISFEGSDTNFKKFFRATKCSFPVLESLSLCFGNDYKQDIPVTFLRGPELSDLHLRRLNLDCLSLAPVSGFLLSTTALTDLELLINGPIEPSTEASLLACLRGMHRLRNLDLAIAPYSLNHPSQNSVPKDPNPMMSELTRFHYIGPNTFLNDLMARFSAPSLRDVCIWLCSFKLLSTGILHIPRFIDDLREQYLIANVTFNRKPRDDFCLSLLTHSADVDHFKPSFRFHANRFPVSMQPITSSSMSSTKLATVEKLTLLFPDTVMVTAWQHDFPLREFLRHFRSVKMLYLYPFVPEVALSFHQDDREALLPLLEEIVLSAPPLSQMTKGLDGEYQHRVAAELAAFEPLISAREQTGRPVNIFHREMPHPIEENCDC